MTDCLNDKVKEMNGQISDLRRENEALEKELERDGIEVGSFTSMGTMDDYWLYYTPKGSDEEQHVAGSWSKESMWETVEEDVRACVADKAGSEITELITDEFLEQKFSDLVGTMAELEMEKTLLEAVADEPRDVWATAEEKMQSFESQKKNNSETYEVVVGNIGTVYRGTDEKEAKRHFDTYKTDSLNQYGRQAGEDVTLMCDNEPEEEFQGFGTYQKWRTPDERVEDDYAKWYGAGGKEGDSATEVSKEFGGYEVSEYQSVIGLGFEEEINAGTPFLKTTTTIDAPDIESAPAIAQIKRDTGEVDTEEEFVEELP